MQEIPFSDIPLLSGLDKINLARLIPNFEQLQKLGEIVPFLEDICRYEYTPGWRRLFEKLNDFFDGKFTPEWEAKIGLNWREWERGEDNP